MERFNNENPLREMFFKYVNRIDELQSSKDIEELQRTLNHVINLLPSNVTSFSIQIYDNEIPLVVTSERESELPKELQKEWGMADLIEYAVSIDSPDFDKPSD